MYSGRKHDEGLSERHHGCLTNDSTGSDMGFEQKPTGAESMSVARKTLGLGGDRGDCVGIAKTRVAT